MTLNDVLNITSSQQTKDVSENLAVIVKMKKKLSLWSKTWWMRTRIISRQLLKWKGTCEDYLKVDRLHYKYARCKRHHQICREAFPSFVRKARWTDCTKVSPRCLMVVWWARSIYFRNSRRKNWNVGSHKAGVHRVCRFFTMSLKSALRGCFSLEPQNLKNPVNGSLIRVVQIFELC